MELSTSKSWFTVIGWARKALIIIATRLESDVVILRGNADEAASSVVRGTVVLCLAEPLSNLKRVSISLRGRTRIGYDARCH